MNRKDIIIEKQQEQIEELTTFLEKQVKKNQLLLEVLHETNKELQKQENNE